MFHQDLSKTMMNNIDYCATIYYISDTLDIIYFKVHSIGLPDI